MKTRETETLRSAYCLRPPLPPVSSVQSALVYDGPSIDLVLPIHIDREAPMRRLATGALVAAGLALAAVSPAMADGDGWGGHHRHHWGNHGGGYFSYNSGGGYYPGYYPGYYYAQPYYYQPPVYYYPAPVYSAPPPPPVYYYPAPVYQGPQFTVVLPFNID